MIQKQETRTPQQNVFYVEYEHPTENTKHKVTFDSVFDTGNCQDVIPVSSNTVMIYDCFSKVKGL